MDTFQQINSGEGRDYDYSQDHCFVKLSSNDTNGTLSIVEDTLKPGFFLPRHHHKIMTEVFYILEGEVEFVFDDETVLARTGDTVTIPPHMWHAARCERGGKMLTIFNQGRFDEYLERLSHMTEEQFDDSTLMQSIAEEFDIYNAS
ncbi:MAG: cupin domain-containing protein [Rhodothermales bacterium]|nr:cupin domain-containing protein [Rhodothermales bacterium]